MFARLTLFLALLFLVAPCFADENPELKGIPQAQLESNLKFKDTWNFRLSPYVWLPGLSGHVNVRANRVAFTDAFSQMVHYLDFSLGLHFEASRGPWALMLDPDYVKITQKPGIRFSNSKTRSSSPRWPIFATGGYGGWRWARVRSWKR